MRTSRIFICGRLLILLFCAAILIAFLLLPPNQEHRKIENFFINSSFPKCVKYPVSGTEMFGGLYPDCSSNDIGWIDGPVINQSMFHWRDGITQPEKDYARPFMIRNGMAKIEGE